MTQDEQLKYCKVCKNRIFDFEQGTLCGKTRQKPAFEGNCEEFIEDDVAVADTEKRKEEVKNSVEISGFLAFFVYWSIPISIIATLVSLFSQWGETSALGIWGVLFEIAFLAFYIYFEIYTVYAFVNRKPDAVFVAKYQLIIIVVVNIVTLLIGGADEDSLLASTPQLIISFIWSAVFFAYLCLSENVKALIPPETRKLSRRNKLLIILSLVIPALLFIIAVFDAAMKEYGSTILSSLKQQLEAACQLRKAELPQELNEELIWTDMSIKGKALVIAYQYTDDASKKYEPVSPEYRDLLSLYQKEIIKLVLSENSMDDDPAFSLCEKLKYDIQYCASTSSGEEVYSFSLSPAEYTEILSDGYTYSLSNDDFQTILNAFNKLMPITYFEDCELNSCTLSENDGSVHYNLYLENLDMEFLSQLTTQDLKSFMLDMFPYFSDAPNVLAVTTNRDIVYDFTADCSSWWKMSARIEPEDYQELSYE